MKEDLPARLHPLTSDFVNDSGAPHSRIKVPITDDIASRICGSIAAMAELGIAKATLYLRPYTYEVIALDMGEAHDSDEDFYDNHIDLAWIGLVVIDRHEDDEIRTVKMSLTASAPNEALTLDSEEWEIGRDDIINQDGQWPIDADWLLATPEDDDPIMFLSHRRYSNITVDKRYDLHMEISDDRWNRIVGTLRAMHKFGIEIAQMPLNDHECGLKNKSKDTANSDDSDGYHFHLVFTWDPFSIWQISILSLAPRPSDGFYVPFISRTEDRIHAREMSALTSRKTNDWVLP